jgi:hypothetical protein
MPRFDERTETEHMVVPFFFSFVINGLSYYFCWPMKEMIGARKTVSSNRGLREEYG